jgi:hypothetical protein
MCNKTDTANPIIPIAKIPSEDIFEIDLNSDMVGFLSICHTLTHFIKNELILVVIAINIVRLQDL